VGDVPLFLRNAIASCSVVSLCACVWRRIHAWVNFVCLDALWGSLVCGRCLGRRRLWLHWGGTTASLYFKILLWDTEEKQGRKDVWWSRLDLWLSSCIIWVSTGNPWTSWLIFTKHVDIRDHPTVVTPYFMPSVMPTYRSFELLRWKGHYRLSL
jgi:hypothetical protein